MQRVGTFFVMVALLALSVSAAPSLSADSLLDFDELYHNQSRSLSFTLSNTGSTPVTGISFSSSAGSDYTLTFSPATIATLGAGGSATVNVKLFAGFGAEIGDNVSVGNVLANTDQGSATLSKMTADIRSYLKIANVRLNGPGFRETITRDGERFEEYLRPSDPFELEVELENVFPSVANQDSEISEIEVEVIIKSIIEDEEDLEFPIQTDELSFEGNDRKKVFRFNSSIPLQTDSDFYEIEIGVSGEDDFGHSVGYTWTVEMQVSKDVHDLRIIQLEAAPKSLSCETQMVISVGVMNLGRNDEKYVTYTLSAPSLGLLIRQSRFQLDSNIDNDENIYRRTHPVAIPIASRGNHTLTLTLYRDGDVLEDVSAIAIPAIGCGPQQAEIQPVEEPQEEPVEETQEEADIEEEPEDVDVGSEEGPEVISSSESRPAVHKAQPVLGTRERKLDPFQVLVPLLLVAAIGFGAFLLLKLMK